MHFCKQFGFTPTLWRLLQEEGEEGVRTMSKNVRMAILHIAVAAVCFIGALIF
ncbi:MAG: hypothetical protein ACLVH3_17415 [Blautia obeum]